MSQSEPVSNRGEILKLGGTLFGVAVLFVVYSDWVQYGSVRSCPTTHLTTLIKALDQYRIESNGELPPLGQEQELLDVYVLDKSTFRCRTGPPYVWPRRAADLSKGQHLIVSCPRAVHGFIRTFSWGVELADGKFRLVRVKNSGEREPIELGQDKEDAATEEGE